MKIAAYCRVSTDKTDQLNSLDAQKRFFAEYTQRTGDLLVGLYADEGISGTKIRKRTEFLRLMADAEQGLFEMVVVKDISRFARNTVDLLQSIRRLKALGIETLFLTANMTSMGNSEFVLTIFGALAQEESANTSKRVKFGKRLNAEKGRVPNLVFGYNKTPGNYFQLTVNEGEAEAVRQMFQWYVEDGYGASKIAAMLNAQGQKTKRGCQWSQSGVCRILSNPLYTGQVINGKEEVSDFLTGQRKVKEKDAWMVTQRPELRIVEPALFEQARQLMKERGARFKTERSRQSNQHLFSTLIRCKECGWSFRRITRTYQNTYVRWGCSCRNGRGSECCPNSFTIGEEELVEAIENYLGAFVQDRQFFLRRTAEAFRHSLQNRFSSDAHIRSLRDRLSKLGNLRQKYLNMYTDDLISREELQQKIGGILPQLERLQHELDLVDIRPAWGPQLDAWMNEHFSCLEHLPDIRQMSNAQLKQIIEKIEVGKDGSVEIYLRLLDNVC